MDGYRAFLDAARNAEDIIRAHPELDDADLAEGYRYLAAMAKFHLERMFAGADLDRPRFVLDMDTLGGWGLPTPDSHYYSAQIDGTGEYRIAGHRGTTVDYCFEVLSGLVGDDGVIGDRIDALEAADIVLQADGRFEIDVGGTPRDDNWLQAGPAARVIFVRQTVADWRTEQPTPMLIERLDRAPALGVRPTGSEIDELYRRAGRNLLDQVRFLDGFARNWTDVLPVNELPAPRVGPADAGYFPGQYNSAGRFDLQPGQGLLVTMAPSSARYQSLSLGHPIWFNSIDPRVRQSSLNQAQSRISSDGMYHYVIAPDDPGVANWLDTGGQHRGFIFLRYQQAAVQPPPAKVRVVALAELPSLLPADEPTVDNTARAEHERRRRLAMDRRYG